MLRAGQKEFSVPQLSASNLRFPPPSLPKHAQKLRAEVRAFLAESWAAEAWRPNSDFGAGFSPEFSRKIADQGWIGMTWPKKYGGRERSMLERYVVTEELLAAGAPVFAHWIADRQSGPLLLRFGTEAQRQAILPRIAAGECFFSIGMSEPDSGSDLASVRTRAERIAEGWRLNGAKVWTSNAHLNHFMIALCRTGEAGEDRHGGLSQFLIDLRHDGLAINAIVNMLGAHEFNEVVFDNVVIPEDPGRSGAGARAVAGSSSSGFRADQSSWTANTTFAQSLGSLGSMGSQPPKKVLICSGIRPGIAGPWLRITTWISALRGFSRPGPPRTSPGGLLTLRWAAKFPTPSGPTTCELPQSRDGTAAIVGARRSPTLHLPMTGKSQFWGSLKTAHQTE